MRGSTRLFRIFGIDIKLHFSWWFIFILLAWSLATSLFPQYAPGLSISMYWFMGILAALLLFISVLLHELSHSLVARAKKIRVESITLFFFGGVAGIEGEDMKPSAEFQMAIAGPLFSLVLSAIFYIIFRFNGNLIVTAITQYLYQLNLILALFNLVPGFPLDGGRAFRAILYAHYKDLKKATRIAAMGGKIVAGVLIVLGLFSFFRGGLWFVLLGGFLYFIAGISYDQVVIKEALQAVPLARVMKKRYPRLSPAMKFSEFVHRYAASEEEAFIVMGKNFVGILDLRQLESLPSGKQSLTVQQAALPLSQVKILKKEDTAYTAFKRFAEQNLELLPVVEKGKVIGVVTRRMVSRQLLWATRYGKQ